jgi:hypothetical protein
MSIAHLNGFSYIIYETGEDVEYEVDKRRDGSTMA